MHNQYRLQHIAYPGQQQAIDELVNLAIDVARNQRGEDHLQPQDVIKHKFMREYAELEEALESKTNLDALSEVADLVYYSVQDYAVAGDEKDLHATIQHVAEKCNITIQQAYTIALAKYRLRAFNPKNFAAENAAIQNALNLNSGE